MRPSHGFPHESDNVPISNNPVSVGATVGGEAHIDVPNRTNLVTGEGPRESSKQHILGMFRKPIQLRVARLPESVDSVGPLTAQVAGKPDTIDVDDLHGQRITRAESLRRQRVSRPSARDVDEAGWQGRQDE
jgi:hypothetical protein